MGSRDGSHLEAGAQSPPMYPQCKCLGIKDSLGRGAACTPQDLLQGSEWCYTSMTCPRAAHTMQGEWFSYCPPAFNRPLPSPPSPPPPAPHKCDVPLRQEANWVPISSASTQQTVSYGTGRVAIGETTHDSGSSSNIGFSIGVGMSFGPVHVGVSLAFGVNEAFQATTSHAFEESTGQTFTTAYGPGVVWQWQWFIETACANHTASAQDMRVTPSLDEPPCCLPGYERELGRPHGWCQPTEKNATISACPKFPGSLPIPPSETPPRAPSTSWLKLGNGFCGADRGVQPDFVLCSGVPSISACKALCVDDFAGHCQVGVLTTCNLLLTTYYLLLTTYYLLRTTYYLLLTTYHALRTTHYALTTYYR